VSGRVDKETLETADALKASGFADLDAILAAVLNSGRIRDRRHRIEAHRQKAAAADSAVDSADQMLEKRRADLGPEDEAVVTDLVAARKATQDAVKQDAVAQDAMHGAESDGGSVFDDDALASLDLTTLADQVSDAQARRDLALRAVETAENLEQQRRECGIRATAAASAFSDAMASFLPIRDMALLACGSTPNAEGQRITLVTYAVTERFRDVLDRTNDLLRDIHDGVYELRLGDHEGRAGGRTGLPIEVYDRRSDTTCEPSTLSGGETFFVSLALALALADVIRAEAGGAAMDTLFVDEGFGTLSQDYLDEVMEVLRGIARTRDVGIISHVGQLREQIGPRISVSRVREDAESRLEVML
uniref:SbcC/MukB-like Walker B domain-containing protein n=1 Tax=uncultured Bifidobacterium sp. TaxID=165187 RepID=UPI00262C9F93